MNWSDPLVIAILGGAFTCVTGLISWCTRRLLGSLNRQDMKLDSIDRRLAVKEAVDAERHDELTAFKIETKANVAEVKVTTAAAIAEVHRRIDSINSKGLA